MIATIVGQWKLASYHRKVPRFSRCLMNDSNSSGGICWWLAGPEVPTVGMSLNARYKEATVFLPCLCGVPEHLASRTGQDRLFAGSSSPLGLQTAPLFSRSLELW